MNRGSFMEFRRTLGPQKDIMDDSRPSLNVEFLRNSKGSNPHLMKAWNHH